MSFPAAQDNGNADKSLCETLEKVVHYYGLSSSTASNHYKIFLMIYIRNIDTDTGV